LEASVMGTKQFLALLEVDKIQKYIFATNKLKEIRGASYLLSEINEKKTKEILHSKEYKNTANPILSVGGMTKVVFDIKDDDIKDDDIKDDAKAKAFLREVETLYKDVNIPVTTHIEPIDDNFSLALNKGEKAIRRKKESKQWGYQANTSPYYRRCTLCGVYPAEYKSLDNDNDNNRYDLLCTSCSMKRSRSNKRLDIYDKLREKFNENGIVIDDWPHQFKQIGKASRREGYMGFIMADANRMGGKIREIQNPEGLRQFSKKIKEINEKCLVDAIWEVFANTKKDNMLPVNILILGGDDMMMVTTAETAIKIALAYCDKFQKATKNDSSTPEISISAGVVIAKDTYPINSYVALGEELLKMAKKKSREYLEEGKEVGTIDYKVVTAAFSESIKITRYKKERIYKKDGDEFVLTFKPYSLEDMKKLIDFGAEFKKQDFPRNKIKSFEQILRQGKEASILDFLMMRSKLSKDNGQKGLMNRFLKDFDMIDTMPWRRKNDDVDDEYESNLLDLVEIYEFS
jgi:hypothetical protein